MAAAAKESGAPPVLDKQALSIDVLTKGYVNSFVDFFYLTHRTDEDKGRVDIPNYQLQYVQENLTNAEKAHRRGDSNKVFDAYERLAGYFQETKDFKTSIYFYEKCLDIAEITKNFAQMGNSNHNLGLTHDAMGDMITAIRFHEKHLQIARHMQEHERSILANKQLVDTYRRYAERFETKGDYTSAVEYYKKCLQSAADIQDLRSEGAATYRLGLTCRAMNDKTTAVKWQLRYLDICRSIDDQLGEGAACAALAAAFKDQQDPVQSIKYLEKYYEIASKNQQLVPEAEACSQLGAIYSDQDMHEKAVSYYEKAYDIARQLGDRKLINASRIALGMSKGNLQMSSYMKVVNNDLPSLLKWKTRRAGTFSAAATAKKE